MYIVKYNGRKVSRIFFHYNSAKSWARRQATKKRGFYLDSYLDEGYSVHQLDQGPIPF